MVAADSAAVDRVIVELMVALLALELAGLTGFLRGMLMSLESLEEGLRRRWS